MAEGPNGPRKGLMAETKDARLVSDKRQKIQLLLAFDLDAKGEAQRASSRDESLPATNDSAVSANDTEHILEEICDAANLKQAMERVIDNDGAPGIDRISVNELRAEYRRRWPKLEKELFAGTYKPQPVRRVEIPKPMGGIRKLGIPTVLDRLLQQAVMQVLQQRFDPTFSEHSYGFRPARSAHQAVETAQEYILAGHTTVVDIDLEKFFDRVNHDILMGLLAKRISDKRVLKLIRAFLNAGVMENGLVSPTEEGTPQGGPLSPLLSNVMLDVLDRELEARSLRFVRYADDCNIYVSSERAGHRVMESVTQFLARKLKLKVNESKSAVAAPWERKFLGFTFLNTEQVHRALAPQAAERFREKVRGLTRRHRGRSIEQTIEQLRPYMIGWRGYFEFCQAPRALHNLESWTRRRLRAKIWHQWKTASNRHAQLRRLGLSVAEASRAVASARNHAAWHTSHIPQIDRALSIPYFTSLGLPHLAPPRRR